MQQLTDRQFELAQRVYTMAQALNDAMRLAAIEGLRVDADTQQISAIGLPTRGRVTVNVYKPITKEKGNHGNS